MAHYFDPEPPVNGHDTPEPQDDDDEPDWWAIWERRQEDHTREAEHVYERFYYGR